MPDLDPAPAPVYSSMVETQERRQFRLEVPPAQQHQRLRPNVERFRTSSSTLTTSIDPVEPAVATAVAVTPPPALDKFARWSEVTLVATVWQDVLAVW